MRLADISLIGWVHSMACTLALILGTWNIAATKGTKPHKWRGLGYVFSMIIANVLALVLYRFDIDLATGKAGAGTFGFFHWLAIAALFFTLAGFYASSRQSRGLWAYLHPICMTLSYYILAGGLINELFARLDVLRPLAVSIVNGKRVFSSPVLGMTHFAVMLAALLLIIVFSVKVWLYRRARVSSPSRARIS
jgi:uncharacterized membrane protein